MFLAVSILCAPLRAAPAAAKLTPAQKCVSAKEAATAKEAAAKIACYSNIKLAAPPDPACLQKAEAKFTEAFAKAEKPGACNVNGDAGSIEAGVDAYVTALVQALQPQARAATPAQTCAVAKLKAASKKTTAKMKCEQQNLSTGSDALLGICFSSAAQRFADAFAKAEALGVCETMGDGAVIGSQVDTWVTGMALLLTPPPHLVDNADGTITDLETGLMWEKKDRSGGLHNASTFYTWAGLCGCTSCSTSGGCTGTPGQCTGSEPLCQPNAAAVSACRAATGGAPECFECSVGSCNVDPFLYPAATTIWDWLGQLNASNFAGHSDWRIPTEGRDGGTAQLETILAAPYPCTINPCVPAVFNTGCAPGCNVTGCSCTPSNSYWSATTVAGSPGNAWFVYFGDGAQFAGNPKEFGLAVRAVRPAQTTTPVPTPTPTAVPALPVCGNGVCEAGEQCTSTPDTCATCCCTDCGCGSFPNFCPSHASVPDCISNVCY